MKPEWDVKTVPHTEVEHGDFYYGMYFGPGDELNVVVSRPLNEAAREVGREHERRMKKRKEEGW